MGHYPNQNFELLQSRLVDALESMRDGFALFDRDDILVTCNRQYHDIFPNAAPQLAPGIRYLDLMHAISGLDMDTEGVAIEVWRARRLELRSHMNQPFEALTRHGRRVAIIDQPTQEGGRVSIVRDITREVEAERELRAARDLAEQANRSKSEFLSSMSHELRTPLNAILGFAQVLEYGRDPPLTREQREHVAHIMEGGRHLLALIGDVLDLARIEAGGLRLSMEAVAAVDVVDAADETLRALARQHGISLEIEQDEDLLVRADRTRLLQVLINFGSNAIKYNRPGGRVRIAVRADGGDLVRFQVDDTGLGIPAEQQARLFEPFNRLGRETSAVDGTGIGLSLVRRLIHLMGGHIGFESRDGQGSSFWVDLPRVVAPRKDPAGIVQSALWLPGAGMNHVLLYIEDNPGNIRMMQQLVGTLTGMSLRTATSGAEGLELARQRPPDLILLDIHMAGMDGYAVLKALKADPELSGIPVIALSAGAMPEDIRRGRAAGFDHYMTKPIDFAAFLAVLRSILGPV